MKRSAYLLGALLLAGCTSTETPYEGPAPGPVRKTTPYLSLRPSTVITKPHVGNCRPPELRDSRGRLCRKRPAYYRPSGD